MASSVSTEVGPSSTGSWLRIHLAGRGRNTGRLGSLPALDAPGAVSISERWSIWRALVHLERRSDGRYLRDPLSMILSVSKGLRNQAITASQLQDGVRNRDFSAC